MANLTKPKKDHLKAWLLTILLHVVIVTAIVGFWHSSRQQDTAKPSVTTRAQTINTQSMSSEQKPDNSLTASDASQPATLASQPTALTTISSSTASVATDFTVTLPPVTFNAPTMYFFDNSQDSAPTQLYPQPLPPQPATEVTRQNRVPQSPANAVLTSRDVPHRERATRQNQDMTDSPTASEASQLSSDIDKNNEQITQLINQVKQNNQKKIDAATAAAMQP